MTVARAARHRARRARRGHAQAVRRRRARARPRPQPRPDHRRARRARAARPALPADVAAGVGPRARRQLRGAVAAARGRRRSRRCGPELDDIYDAFEHPRADPADAAAAAARPRPATTSAWCAARCSTRSTRSALDPAGALLDDGFVFGMVAPARAPARRDDAGHPPAAPRRPGAARPPTRCPRRPALITLPPRCWCPAARSRWAPPTDPWALRQRAAGARGRRAAVSASTRCRSPTPPTARSSRPAATTTSGWWTAAGWRVALRVRASAPRRSGSARAGSWTAPPVRPRRAAARRRAGAARLLVRGRRLRPLGRAGGCRPRPSGRRPRPGTRRPAPSAASRGATRRRPTSAPTSARPATARPPAGSSPAGASPCGALQMVGDVWEWTSSRVHRLPGFRSFPYKEYSEVFFGDGYKVLRGGSLGHRPAGLPDHLPQLGLPDPAADLRRLPHAPADA